MILTKNTDYSKTQQRNKTKMKSIMAQSLFLVIILMIPLIHTTSLKQDNDNNNTTNNNTTSNNTISNNNTANNNTTNNNNNNNSNNNNSNNDDVNQTNIKQIRRNKYGIDSALCNTNQKGESTAICSCAGNKTILYSSLETLTTVCYKKEELKNRTRCKQFETVSSDQQRVPLTGLCDAGQMLSIDSVALWDMDVELPLTDNTTTNVNTRNMIYRCDKRTFLEVNIHFIYFYTFDSLITCPVRTIFIFAAPFCS